MKERQSFGDYQAKLLRDIIAPSLIQDDAGWYLPARYSDGTDVNIKTLFYIRRCVN